MIIEIIFIVWLFGFLMLLNLLLPFIAYGLISTEIMMMIEYFREKKIRKTRV